MNRNTSLRDYHAVNDLLSGISRVDLREFKKRFCWNEHRLELFSSFEKAMEVLRKAGALAVIIGGSYVRNVEYPDDIDACWLAGKNFDEDNVPPQWEDMIYSRKKMKDSLNLHFQAIYYENLDSPIACGVLENWLAVHQMDRNGEEREVFLIDLCLTG